MRSGSPRNARLSAESPPVALHERAEADLAFVRSVVERSTQFTAVPGVGGVLMGLSALVAAFLAEQQANSARWLGVWFIEMLVATTIGTLMMVRKARRAGLSLGAGPARRFAFGLMPPLLVGGVLTVGATGIGAWSLLPPIWLCCYGIAVLGAGAVSAAPIVPAMGGVFVLTGMLAVATPATWGGVWLALAFGVAHIVTGIVVARNHGG